MAEKLSASMTKYFNDGMKTWLLKRSDTEMYDVHLEDLEDLGMVLFFLANKNEELGVTLAFEKACELDTLVRDVIPKEVWNWMSKVHAWEKGEHWAKMDDGQKYNILAKDDQGCDKN